MLRSLSLLLAAPLGLGVALSLPAVAAPDLPNGTCITGAGGHITCDLRAVVPATLDKIERINDAMNGDSLMVTPFEGTAAWLMLVDETHQSPIGLITDDRYGGIRADLTDMIEQASDRRLIEVQTYDGTLETLSPFGADPNQALANLDRLQAQEVAPQDRSGLYLSALSAIERLAALDADRKALVLFTDGRQNASTSSVNRLIDAADEAGVIIIGMAYAGGEADLANHLDLREMASRTQGTTLYPSMTNQRLSDDNLRGFFATLENGGTLELSMESVDTNAVRVRALYSDGRTMDGMLSIPERQ
jgi:hypothetical protein